MDRSNVNGEFYDLVRRRLLQETNKLMLNTSSCRLRIVHSDFKHGVDASGWNIDKFLRSVPWLLKIDENITEYQLKMNS